VNSLPSFTVLSVKHKTPLKQSFSSCVENLHYLACFAQLLLDGRSACQGRTPHPAACPLCDQEEESIQHLLLSSVFAQQVWFIIFWWLGLAAMPSHHNLPPADSQVGGARQ